MTTQNEPRSRRRKADTATVHGVVLSEPTHAQPLQIGDGFEALSFKHEQFHGLMDPLVMVDHFTMTEPTFGAHPHAGMSAVSVLFEDSEGRFHNRDSLGNDVDLLPGDLYWLKAGRGAVHDEAPLSGARTHALQIFVNLPARMKHDAPDALHVPGATMPVIEGDGRRVRVVLGETQGVLGASSPALPSPSSTCSSKRAAATPTTCRRAKARGCTPSAATRASASRVGRRGGRGPSARPSQWPHEDHARDPQPRWWPDRAARRQPHRRALRSTRPFRHEHLRRAQGGFGGLRRGRLGSIE